MSEISRRKFLRTAPVAAAAVAVPSAALAIPEADPIYAAIEAHRAARKAFRHSLEGEPGWDDPARAAWEEAEDRTSLAELQAAGRLTLTPILTLSGLLALLRYVDIEGGCWPPLFEEAVIGRAVEVIEAVS